MLLLKKTFIKSIKIFFNLLNLEISRKQKIVDFYLYQYNSFEEYKTTQIYHNKRKIDKIWSDEHTLNRLANIILKDAKCENYPILGICHGSRNGFEQNYLNKINKKIFAIGTDISETALSFDNSIQWDFHDPNPYWIGHFDFVYTNSLDHAYDPKKAITTWLDQLKKDGKLVIELTKEHEPQQASKMDPFGIKINIFAHYLITCFGNKIGISYSVAPKQNMNLDAYLFVITKHND